MNQLWSKKGRKRSQEQLQVSSKATPFSERALFVAGCRDPSRALQASLLQYGGDSAERQKGKEAKNPDRSRMSSRDPGTYKN